MSDMSLDPKAVEDAIVEQMLEADEHERRTGTASEEGPRQPEEYTDADVERTLRKALLWHTFESLAKRLDLDHESIQHRFAERLERRRKESSRE